MLGIIQSFCDQVEVATAKNNFIPIKQLIGQLEPIRLSSPMFWVWLLMLGIIQLFCDQAEDAMTKYNFLPIN